MIKRKIRHKDSGILAQSTHLGDEESALVIDALRSGMRPPLPDGLLNHVENCPDCQAKILEIHHYLKNPIAPSTFVQVRDMFSVKKPKVPAWLPLSGRAAAALFVFTLLAAVYFSLPRGGSHFLPANPEINSIASPTQTAQVNASKIPSQTMPIKNVTGKKPQAIFSGESGGNSSRKASAFAVNQNLEFMVGSRSRSFIIEVYSPGNHATLEDEIMFSWREFTSEPLSLVILNNRNETVARSPVRSGRFQFNQPLPPGCYYWKLESADELYYVGKFFIGSVSKSLK